MLKQKQQFIVLHIFILLRILELFTIYSDIVRSVFLYENVVGQLRLQRRYDGVFEL